MRMPNFASKRMVVAIFMLAALSKSQANPSILENLEEVFDDQISTKEEETFETPQNTQLVNFAKYMQSNEDNLAAGQRWDTAIRKTARGVVMKEIDHWMVCARSLIFSRKGVENIKLGVDHFAKMSSADLPFKQIVEYGKLCEKRLLELKKSTVKAKVSNEDVKEILSYSNTKYPKNKGLNEMLKAHFHYGDHCHLRYGQLRALIVVDFGININFGECTGVLGHRYKITQEKGFDVKLARPNLKQPSAQVKVQSLRFRMPPTSRTYAIRFDRPIQHSLLEETDIVSVGILANSSYYHGPKQPEGLQVIDELNVIEDAKFAAGYRNQGFEQIQRPLIRKVARLDDALFVIYGYLGIANGHYSPVDYGDKSLGITEKDFVTKSL